MSQKKIIPFINGENELSSSLSHWLTGIAARGADSLYLYNFTGDEATHEEFLHTLREIEKDIDIPFMAGVHVNRFEDAKKALYTGASRIVMLQGGTSGGEGAYRDPGAL